MQMQSGQMCDVADPKGIDRASVSILRMPYGVNLEALYDHEYSEELGGHLGAKRVMVEVREGDKRVYRRVFWPRYEVVEVNGPGCGTDEYSPRMTDFFESVGAAN